MAAIRHDPPRPPPGPPPPPPLPPRARLPLAPPARPTPPPLDVARALAPRIRARAAEIEATRQLPPDLVRELADARLFKVALPEAEGGLGADVITALQVIEEVSRADGSTGWCLALAGPQSTPLRA